MEPVPEDLPGLSFTQDRDIVPLRAEDTGVEEVVDTPAEPDSSAAATGVGSFYNSKV